MWRQQLPVSSWTSPASMLHAIPRVLDRSPRTLRALEAHARHELGASSVLLTQSGTAALMMAMQALVPPGGTVALPAYGCADLATAATGAGVRVRLYDLDPLTLGVDIPSLLATLGRGAHAVVIAHLHGIPTDVAAIRLAIAPFDVPIIEDAAQGLGARVGGAPAGGLGDLSVLSFGRGKGVSGGSGGALVVQAPYLHRVRDARIHAEGERGWGSLAVSLAMWALGRPMLYRLPASLPFLQLGEMVYHDPPVPAGMPSACASMALAAWRRLPRIIEQRQSVVHALQEQSAPSGIVPISVAATSAPSWLRYPALVPSRATTAPTLGILRGYPLTLAEQPHAIRLLHPQEPRMPGAERLRDELMTLPTHHHVTNADVAQLRKWLREWPRDSVRAAVPPGGVRDAPTT